MTPAAKKGRAMKTIKTVVYEFDELSDKAKEKARDWWRECSAYDDFWSECAIDEAIEQGNLLGITFKLRDVKLNNGKTWQKPCIYYSGFASQGDGACFEGAWHASDVKADKVADGWGDAPATKEIKRIARELAAVAKELPAGCATVRHNDRYYHSRSVDITLENDDGEGNDAGITTSQQEAVEEALRDFCDWIYRQLEDAYTYSQANEQVDDNIRCNAYTFTADGQRFA